MFDIPEKILIRRHDFYKIICGYREHRGSDFEKYAKKNLEKWFVVDPQSGRMWLVSCDKFEEFRLLDIVFVLRWMDVMVPLYNKDGKYLCMCNDDFPISDWLEGEIEDPVFLNKSRDVPDMSEWQEVEIVGDGADS